MLISKNISHKTLVQNLIYEIFDNEFSKYLNARYKYRRLVMIKIDQCYICKSNKSQKEILEKYLNNTEGLNKRIGWIYCKDCTKYINLAQIYIEANSKYLSNYVYKDLSKLNLSFFRISSNKFKKPYIQKNSTIGTCIDYLTIIQKNNRLYVNVCWKDSYYKLIYLSNLIYFNSDIFGFNYKSFPLFKYKYDMYKNHIWKFNWIPLIEKEYKIIYNWYLAKSIILKYLNSDTINLIFSYWISDIV